MADFEYRGRVSQAVVDASNAVAALNLRVQDPELGERDAIRSLATVYAELQIVANLLGIHGVEQQQQQLGVDRRSAEERVIEITKWFYARFERDRYTPR